LDEAIETNNSIPQGLSNSIFTCNLEIILKWIACATLEIILLLFPWGVMQVQKIGMWKFGGVQVFDVGCVYPHIFG
jgi:hypothetical protein